MYKRQSLKQQVFDTMPLNQPVKVLLQLVPCLPRFSPQEIRKALWNLHKNDLVKRTGNKDEWVRLVKEYPFRSRQTRVHPSSAEPKGIREKGQQPGEVIVRRPRGTNGSDLAPDMPKDIDTAADSVLEAVDHLITLVRQEVRKAPDVDLKTENDRLKSIIKDKLNI